MPSFAGLPARARQQWHPVTSTSLSSKFHERIKFQSASANLSRNYNAATMSKSLVFHCTWWERNETSERIAQRPPCHFPSRAVPSRPGAGRNTNTNNMYTHCTSCTADCTHCTCCTHAPLQKLACCLVPCLSLLTGSRPCIVLGRYPARYARFTIPLMAHRFTTIQPPRILDALARCARNALRASFC